MYLNLENQATWYVVKEYRLCNKCFVCDCIFAWGSFMDWVHPCSLFFIFPWRLWAFSTYRIAGLSARKRLFPGQSRSALEMFYSSVTCCFPHCHLSRAQQPEYCHKWSVKPSWAGLCWCVAFHTGIRAKKPLRVSQTTPEQSFAGSDNVQCTFPYYSPVSPDFWYLCSQGVLGDVWWRSCFCPRCAYRCSGEGERWVDIQERSMLALIGLNDLRSPFQPKWFYGS